jgi:hypothetical protein
VKDKHSRAYSNLTGAVGVRMGAILGIGKVQESPRCLACHALNVPATERAHTFDLSDGVSCESCHGPAAAWLGPHTEQGWTHQQSLALGMYDTRDVVKRTENCLSCHLGNQEQFVDHNLIAAGHPDLSFELGTFSAVMPRHWKTPIAGSTDRWEQVRDMGVSQAVQLREDMTQLARRARGDNWPEYSEMDCYACHHSLTQPQTSWRQARGYPERRAGNPPWNDSRYAIFHYLARQADEELAKELATDLGQVSKAMSQLSPERKGVEQAAERAAQVSDELARKLKAMPCDQALTLRLMQQISADGDGIAARGERPAEQSAMVIQSLFVAYSGNASLPSQGEIREAINDLFKEFQDPSAYDPSRFSARMRRVSALLH